MIVYFNKNRMNERDGNGFDFHAAGRGSDESKWTSKMGLLGKFTGIVDPELHVNSIDPATKGGTKQRYCCNCLKNGQ